MVNFQANDRYSKRWDGSNWIEEVAVASGISYDDSSVVVTSGAETVQEALETLDSTLDALTSPPASGAVNIDEVVNVSGVSSSSLGSIETIQFGPDNDPTAGFSFTVFAAAVDPVTVKTFYAVTTSGQTGTVAYDLQYNVLSQGDDLTPASEFPDTASATSAVTPADFEEMRQFNFTIPLAKFTGAGSAPYIVNCRLVRNSTTDTLDSANVDILKIYADGVPGAMAGTYPGYTGGNLTVDGDLTVEGALIYQKLGVAIPANGSDTGVSGTVSYDDDFVYFCVNTNTWKRTAIADF